MWVYEGYGTIHPRIEADYLEDYQCTFQTSMENRAYLIRPTETWSLTIIGTEVGATTHEVILDDFVSPTTALSFLQYVNSKIQTAIRGSMPDSDVNRYCVFANSLADQHKASLLRLTEHMPNVIFSENLANVLGFNVVENAVTQRTDAQVPMEVLTTRFIYMRLNSGPLNLNISTKTRFVDHDYGSNETTFRFKSNRVSESSAGTITPQTGRAEILQFSDQRIMNGNDLLGLTKISVCNEFGEVMTDNRFTIKIVIQKTTQRHQERTERKQKQATQKKKKKTLNADLKKVQDMKDLDPKSITPLINPYEFMRFYESLPREDYDFGLELVSRARLRSLELKEAYDVLREYGVDELINYLDSINVHSEEGIKQMNAMRKIAHNLLKRSYDENELRQITSTNPPPKKVLSYLYEGYLPVENKYTPISGEGFNKFMNYSNIKFEPSLDYDVATELQSRYKDKVGKIDLARLANIDEYNEFVETNLGPIDESEAVPDSEQLRFINAGEGFSDHIEYIDFVDYLKQNDLREVILREGRYMSEMDINAFRDTKKIKNPFETYLKYIQSFPYFPAYPELEYDLFVESIGGLGGILDDIIKETSEPNKIIDNFIISVEELIGVPDSLNFQWLNIVDELNDIINDWNENQTDTVDFSQKVDSVQEDIWKLVNDWHSL